MAGWIKMPLGMEVGLGPSDIVLDGDPAPLPKKGAEPPIFGPCLLSPNGWMDIQPGNGEGLFWFRCFINMSLIYLLTYLDAYPFLTWGGKWY